MSGSTKIGRPSQRAPRCQRRSNALVLNQFSTSGWGIQNREPKRRWYTKQIVCSNVGAPGLAVPFCALVCRAPRAAPSFSRARQENTQHSNCGMYTLADQTRPHAPAVDFRRRPVATDVQRTEATCVVGCQSSSRFLGRSQKSFWPQDKKRLGVKNEYLAGRMRNTC